MPFRRKTSKQLEEAGQPIEKSLSSPNISEHSQNPGRNYLDPGSVTVQRKKSWLSRLLKPFRKSKSRTLTEPTEQPTSSCFPLQKSSTTFYTSPYSPLERAPSQKKNAETKKESSESEDSESSDEKKEVPATTIPTFMQPTLLAELKSSLMEREQCNGSESPEPMCDNPKPIKKTSFKTKSRPLSADSGLFSADLRNLEQIMENFYDVPDRGLFTEQRIVSVNQIQQVKPRKQWNDAENQDFVNCKDFTYMEPQPIEPLHKFPKPRPPVNRRPSTRKASRTAEDLDIPNPRRSEAELEDIIRKINEIPPPDVEPPMQNLSEIEIPSAQPIPKKRTILPSSPTLKSQEQSQTVQIIDNAIDINYTQPSLTEQALLESIHSNQQIIKPELPTKTRKPILGSNSSPKSAVSSPDKSISVYDIVKAFDEKIIIGDDLDIKPMKRVRTLPIRFHDTKDINKESSNVFTGLLNSHNKQKHALFKRTYSLHSKGILQNNLVEPDVKSINKLNTKEKEGEEANSPGEMITEIRKDIYRQNKTISISRESYMTEFQNTMDNYLREIHDHEENFNQKTPPNTPEQFEEPTEHQDETLIEINRKEISDGEPIESTALSTEKLKRERPYSLEIKSNLSLGSCIIANDIYESLSPLMNFEETERFLQEERSSSDRDTIAPDGTNDSPFGIIESSENSENLPDISHKTETANKSQIQETIMNLKKTTLTFQKPNIQGKPDYLVRKGAMRQKYNSSSDHHSSNHLKQTHYNTSKTKNTASEQVQISTKDSSPKLYLNSEPLNQEEPETKRHRSKSLY